MTIESFYWPLHTVSEANYSGKLREKMKRKKMQRRYAYMSLRERKRVWTAPMTVTLTRVAPRRLDEGDNLNMSFKSIRDGIADAVGVDDRDSSYIWVYKQKKGKPREYAVIVEIQEESVE